MTNAINDRPSYRVVSYRAVPPYYYAPCYSIRLGGETKSRNENESGTRSPRRELKSLLGLGSATKSDAERNASALLDFPDSTGPPLLLPRASLAPPTEPRQRRSALAAPQAPITTTEPGPVRSTEKENASIPPYWALPFQPFSFLERSRDRAVVT